MTMTITEDCTACYACEPECPNEAIRMGKGGIFVIEPELCTDCEGYFEQSQCVAVCSVDACVPV